MYYDMNCEFILKNLMQILLNFKFYLPSNIAFKIKSLKNDHY